MSSLIFEFFTKRQSLFFNWRSIKTPDLVYKLNLSEKGYIYLPESIGNFTNLVWVDLSFNNLTTLPSTFKNLNHLTDLYLNYNQFDSIPDLVYGLSTLTYLD